MKEEWDIKVLSIHSRNERLFGEGTIPNSVLFKVTALPTITAIPGITALPAIAGLGIAGLLATAAFAGIAALPAIAEVPTIADGTATAALAAIVGVATAAFAVLPTEHTPLGVIFFVLLLFTLPLDHGAAIFRRECGRRWINSIVSHDFIHAEFGANASVKVEIGELSSPSATKATLSALRCSP